MEASTITTTDAGPNPLWGAFDQLRIASVQLRAAGECYELATGDATLTATADEITRLARSLERFAREGDDYHLGRQDGRHDATVLLHPRHVGGHTLEAYNRIRRAYAAAISPQGQAVAYYRGYADAFDAVAIQAGYGQPTDDEIEEFYLDL